jgi:hypothetical protein
MHGLIAIGRVGRAAATHRITFFESLLEKLKLARLGLPSNGIATCRKFVCGAIVNS